MEDITDPSPRSFRGPSSEYKKMQVTTEIEKTGGIKAVDRRQAETAAIAAMFHFAGRCIEAEADAQLIDWVRGELRQPLESAGLSFGDDFHAADEASLIEDLAEEYTALFVAPGCISPYASVFETGCLFRDPADRAIEAYREAGWDYQARMSGEFPDHIGTMLGFYGLLADSEVECLSRGDIEGADEWNERRETFLVEQLGQWGPGWCRLATQAANHVFYRAILQLAEQLLWGELDRVVDRRSMRELVELNLREPKRLDYDADFRKASGV